MVFSEVSRGHSKPETSPQSGEGSQKGEGLNVRMVKQSGSLMVQVTTTETRKRTATGEDKPEAEVKPVEELSQTMQPMRATPGTDVFFK